MTGVFVAATVVTLLHWLRVHDRRLLPLMGLFAMLAAARSLEGGHPWRDAFELGAVACGLSLLRLAERPAAPRP